MAATSHKQPFEGRRLLRRVCERDVSGQTSAEQKIKSMVECKDFCKGIIQLQWEHKKLKMQMEDLNNKSRDIRQLKLTEEQRDVSAISFLQNPDVVL